MALFNKDGGKPKYGKLTKSQRAITFYAEDGGSWPHYEPIVSELLGRHGRGILFQLFHRELGCETCFHCL